MLPQPEEAPRRYFSLEEYFALEKVEEVRYEYWDGDIVCMNGVPKEHADVTRNVFFYLRTAIGDGNRTFGNLIPLKTPSLPPYRYPDAMVMNEQPNFEKISGIDVVTNPTLVVEVMSPHTEWRDRTIKKFAYQELPSVQQCLLIWQHLPHLTLFTRVGDVWQRQDFADLQGSISLVSINCELALRDIYENVEFD